MMPRRFCLEFIAATWITCAVSGCYAEAKTAAPARPSEIPIDTESARREAKRPDPTEGEDVTNGPLEASNEAAAGGGSGGGADGASPPRGGRAAALASGPPSAKLTKPQCDQMMDKYVELVIAGGGSPLKGVNGKELENARNMIKSMVSQDPNFQGFNRACLRDGTRAQYSCAMVARNAEEYQQCIR